MPIRATCLLLLVLLAFSAGCSESTRDLTPVFGSSLAMDTVENASTVKAYRLRAPSYYNELLADYETTAGPIDVDDASASQLRSLLLDSTSYDWESAKGCEPDYGVRIQFQRGSDSVDVLLCFACNILTVYHNGKAVGGEDFDDISSKLVAIAKKLFPDDEAIQSLE